MTDDRPRALFHDPDLLRHPHDALVKRIFTRPEAAAVELRAMLPTALCEQLDWSTLRVEPASFVDERLRSRHSDILYSLRTKDDAREVLVYVLLDHQSTLDPMMAWRFLRYVTRVWERYERSHRPLDALPLVMPLLLYQGPAGWTAPRRLSELLDVPPQLDRAFPTPVELVFAVDELNETIVDDGLAAEEFVALVESTRALLRYAKFSDPPTSAADPRIRALGAQLDLVRERLGVEVLQTLLVYLLTAYRPRSGNLHDILLDSASKETRQMFTSMRDELIAEGRSEGMATMIVQLLRRRGLAVDDATRARVLGCSDETQLERWFDRAVTASSVEQLFDS
ncbi:MAG: Rpn family recombination-promoting nuclease/putative transposase [Nannocystaceae bacterium]